MVLFVYGVTYVTLNLGKTFSIMNFTNQYTLDNFSFCFVKAMLKFFKDFELMN